MQTASQSASANNAAPRSVALVGVRTTAAERAQEKIFGGMLNQSIDALVARFGALPGVSDATREAVRVIQRGSVNPTLAGISAAMGDIAVGNPRKGVLRNFDFRSLPGLQDARIEFLERYGMRGISTATSAQDVCAIADNLEPDAIAAMRRTRLGAGLPMPHLITVSEFDAHRAELEREYGPAEMFTRDPNHPDQRSVRVAAFMNDKLKTTALARSLGVPVADVYYSGPAHGLRPDDMPPGMGVLRRDVSAGGSGVFITDGPSSLRDRLAPIPATEPVLLQKYKEGEDISFLFFCDDGGMRLESATRRQPDATLISSSTQIMEHMVAHVGNCIPGDRSIIADAFAKSMRPIANWARANGYRGHLGIDARVVDGGKRCIFIEVNPRRTAVSTPTVLATLLGFSQFAHRQLVFKDKAALEATIEHWRYKAGDPVRGKRGILITTYLGDPGKKYKSEFVFLDRNASGLALCEEVMKWAQEQGLLYDPHAAH